MNSDENKSIPRTPIGNGHVVACTPSELYAAEVAKCAVCGDVVKDRKGTISDRACPGPEGLGPEPGILAPAAFGGGISGSEAPGTYMPAAELLLSWDDNAAGLHPTSPFTITLKNQACLECGAGTTYQPALTFHTDGRVEVGRGLTPDAAAQAVVEALRPRFAAMIADERKGLSTAHVATLPDGSTVVLPPGTVLREAPPGHQPDGGFVFGPAPVEVAPCAACGLPRVRHVAALSDRERDVLGLRNGGPIAFDEDGYIMCDGYTAPEHRDPKPENALPAEPLGEPQRYVFRHRETGETFVVDAQAPLVITNVAPDDTDPSRR